MMIINHCFREMSDYLIYLIYEYLPFSNNNNFDNNQKLKFQVLLKVSILDYVM